MHCLNSFKKHKVKLKLKFFIQINPNMDTGRTVYNTLGLRRAETRRNHQQMRRKTHKGGETGGHMNTTILRCPVLSAAANHAP